MECWNIRIQTI